ncbi:Integrase catalytic core [Arabidopsis thaliana x Arabidopsis arenosa]|uniref:Integrase catalytic core n=1 Tax=Arabidopsis thaliana x Arabidopsis arenosa TaxID=1240361 RepID=A0A8T1Z104_9BRAS|nr:Integrase catalytic core [Arabidopsis thaliana x Arabidopsis arenosa]
MTLDHVYSEVVAEERHLLVAWSKEERIEAVGFAVKAGVNTIASAARLNQGPCTHYGCTNHSVDTCFELHGLPDWWIEKHGTPRRSSRIETTRGRGRGSNRGRGRGRNSYRANNAHVTFDDEFSDLPDVSKETWATIKDLLKSDQSANYDEFSGKRSCVEFLLDSGASHHMTGDDDLLVDTHDIPRSIIVLPNGKHTFATKEGTMLLGDHVQLNRVLYVPDLSCTLLSLARLLREMSCYALFTDKFCVIQDRTSKMLIGAVASTCGALYFLTIGDDNSRAVWTYLILANSEVAVHLKQFVAMALQQFGKKIKVVRSDNGSEFLSLRTFFKDNSIYHQTSCVYTPQQNSRVKRKHRHILNVARSLLFQSGLPIKFWGESILTVAYLINRTPTTLLQAAPAGILDRGSDSPESAPLDSSDKPLSTNEPVVVTSDDASMTFLVMILLTLTLLYLSQLMVLILVLNRLALGSKRVYRLKFNSDGTLERYKARLVALGNHKKEGVDFSETFAPVANLQTVRTLASVKHWELHQMDVHNAFLHGDLEEDIYMKPPPGFLPSDPSLVCKLKKSIYGLRQAPRCWFSKLSTALLDYGFTRSHKDNSLFTYSRGAVVLHVLVYVDDLIVCGNDSAVIASFKAYLSRCFKMKDLGMLKYFLSIEVAHGPDGIFLSQRKYCLDIIEECGLFGSRPVDTPLEQNHKFLASTSKPFESPDQYRRLVGRLVYLTHTWPELSYAVNILAEFMQVPLIDHWEAAQRLVRYLKSSPGQGIVLSSTAPLQVNAYCDYDYNSCPKTSKSLTGYMVMLGDSPLAWKTKKQSRVSLSSAEAKYRAMDMTYKELLWLKEILSFLGVKHSQPMRLYCDNKAALHIAANSVFHEQTKHIESDCHFIRDEIVSGNITTAYLSTHE